MPNPAKDYADRMQAAKESVLAVEASVPTELKHESGRASVTPVGYCRLEFVPVRRTGSEIIITADDALALGRWLASTFGENK